MGGKQLDIPGTEREKIPAIDNAADNYVKIRDRRMKLTDQECAAKLELLNVCLEHETKLSKDEDGNRIYRYDDEMVILKPGRRNVKVKMAGEDEEPETE